AASEACAGTAPAAQTGIRLEGLVAEVAPPEVQGAMVEALQRRVVQRRRPQATAPDQVRGARTDVEVAEGATSRLSDPVHPLHLAMPGRRTAASGSGRQAATLAPQGVLVR